MKGSWSPGARTTPLVVAIGATAILVSLFARTVDLTPHVDETFFFSAHDPQLRADHEIDRLFPDAPQILIAVQGPITSPTYDARLRELTDAVARVPGVVSIESLSRGPKSVEDAVKSPLWSRLLIAPDKRSSNLFVTLARGRDALVAEEIDRLRTRFERPGFHLAISGEPYVNAHIEEGLKADLRTFSLAALCLFGIVLFVVFRSLWIVLGTIAACADASAATLLVTHALHMPIGPLTANLSTMVLVMTLSPIVFLTFNWRRLASQVEVPQTGREAMRAAVRQTVVASFWSSVCMVLGFLSLLLVPATPMRHLGLAGGLGAALAFTAAYTVYPWFLEQVGRGRSPTPAAGTSGTSSPEIDRGPVAAFFARRHGGIVAALALLTVVMTYGLRYLDTDPSLPSYFKAGSDIRSGLDLVDDTGGSSPLKIVVEDGRGGPLDTKEADRRLWALQLALEHDPAVGTVISLPLVLGEVHRHWYSFLLSDKHWLNILDSPKHGEVARHFIDADRTRALFLLRMRETDRSAPRAAVIARLTRVVRDSGFQPALLGGTYQLLDEQARLVTSSIVTGVCLLIGIFAVMGFAFSRSATVAAAMAVSLAVIPVVVRGAIAYLGMPLDFVTASAANLDLGMGVDAMIYLTLAARRARHAPADPWAAWSTACAELWRPIGTSLFVVVAGFGIFLLSRFPPTQRFGAFVMLGSATAALVALLMFPWLASLALGHHKPARPIPGSTHTDLARAAQP